MSRPILPLLLTLGWLLLTASGCTKTYSTEVASSQKISETTGNFNSILNTGDQFGSAIANIGDLDNDGVIDLAVGVPYDDNNGTDRGAVWILFMNDNGQVDIKQKLADNTGGFGVGLDDADQFGSAVTALGDLNNDGFLDIAVGAPGDDDGGNNRGAIWILFLNSNGTVQTKQKISNLAGGFTGDLTDNIQFGRTVANIGDLNNDGVADLAVGVQDDDDGGTNRGAVWILFMKTDGTVSSQQKISSVTGGFTGDLADEDYFGSAVTAIGDLDGDGIGDLAVGTSGDDDGGTDRGALWILFMNRAGTVKSAQKISAIEGLFDRTLRDGDQFGTAVANIGDINADGINDLSVGVKFDDDGGVDRGALYIVFMERTGAVISSSKISNTQGNFTGVITEGNQFSSDLTLIGDLNRDGVSDLAVGASMDDDGGIDKGAVWILFMSPVKIESTSNSNKLDSTDKFIFTEVFR